MMLLTLVAVMLALSSYRSDLGRIYPMFALNVEQVNDVTTNINVFEELPAAFNNQVRRVRTTCAVPGLTPRMLILWVSDGSQFRLTYPQPFSENLADYLTANTQIQAFEFVGERIKDGRLRRMLPNV